MSESHLPNVCKCLMAKTNSLWRNFLISSISNILFNIIAEAPAQITQSYNNGFWKICADILFKIFSALSRQKKLKNWKNNFLYQLNNAALMNLRRWTHCSSQQQKIDVKWRINADTWRVCACYLGSRERLLH